MRNYELHSGDHALYTAYLGLHYPEHMIDDIQDLEDLIQVLICLDEEQAREWFSAHDITIVQSDIWIHDKDAIITIFVIKNDQQFITLFIFF